jgi:hypothetical protein
MELMQELPWLEEDERKSPEVAILQSNLESTLPQIGPRVGFVIPLDSKFARIWGFCWFLMGVWIFFIFPLQFLYQRRFAFVNLVVNVMLVVDIVVSFFLSFEDPVTLLPVMNQRHIAKHYLRTWFIWDVLALAPVVINIVNVSTGRISNQGSTNALFLVFLKVPKIVLIIRNFISGSYRLTIEKIEQKLHPSIWRALRFFALFFGGLNFLGCFWYYIGAQHAENPNSWLNRYYTDPDSFSLFFKYLSSVYFVLVSIATVGFGDITPKTIGEYFFVTVLIFLGVGFFAYVTAVLTSWVAERDRKRVIYRNKLKTVKEFADRFKLDPRIREVLFKRSRKAWTEEEEGTQKKQPDDILAELPGHQVFPLLPIVYADLIHISRFLTSLSGVVRTPEEELELNTPAISFTQELLWYVNEKKRFQKGSILAWQSWKVNEVYIVLSGEVALGIQSLTERRKRRLRLWKRVGQGSVLGIIELFTDVLSPMNLTTQGTWITSVECISDECEVLAFNPDDFRQLVETYGLNLRILEQSDKYILDMRSQ